MPHTDICIPSTSKKELQQLLLKLASQLTDLSEEVDDLLPDPNPDADFSQLRPFEQYFKYIAISQDLEKLNSLLLPPYHRVMQHIGSFIETKAIYIICKFKIPDLLHTQPMPIDVIAKKVGLKLDLLAALMRMLIGLGYFIEIPEPGSQMFANNTFSNVLRQYHPNSVRCRALYWGEEWYRSMGQANEFPLEGSTDIPFQKVYGMDFWSWLDQPENEEKRHSFEGGMISQDSLVTCGLLEDYDWDRHNGQMIVDIGSGVGAFSYKLHKRYPELNGILLDRPEVIKDAKMIWAKDHKKLLDKVQFQGGNFFEAIPSGHDVYFMRFVLHDWHNKECQQILSNVRKAIPPNGTLLIADTIIEDPPGDRLAQQMN
ncbi:hypothetical protein K7432_014135, partial [Basidiobolus ranarum]